MSTTLTTKPLKTSNGMRNSVYNLSSKIIISTWNTLMNQRNIKVNSAYLVMIFIIGLISAYDNTVSWVYKDVLLDNEENAIGRWLIRLGDPMGKDVSWFLLAKAIGTILVTLVMFRLVYTKYRVAIIPIFLFQVWIFWYLNFSDFINQEWWEIAQEHGLDDQHIDYNTFAKVIKIWQGYWGI